MRKVVLGLFLLVPFNGSGQSINLAATPISSNSQFTNLAALQAQFSTTQLTAAARSGKPLVAQVTEMGRDHRAWQRVYAVSNHAGGIVLKKRSYTELETGMNHLVNGQWVKSGEAIEPAAGGALGTNGAHQVAFALNVNTPGTVVRVVTPDQRQLDTHILGLAYYDFKNSNQVLFAELKDTTGQIVGANQVLYTNAFTEIQADVLYTYTKAGLEQNIILRERPPAPQNYGLDYEYTRLQVVTEFLNAPTPTIKQKIKRGWKKATVDKIIDFGQYKIGRGRAFSLGTTAGNVEGVEVEKHWQTWDGRTFLIEEVAMRQLTAELAALPAHFGTNNLPGGTPGAAPSSTQTNAAAMSRRTYAHFQLPARKPEAKRSLEPMKIATLPQKSKGLVLDYALLSGATDFVFQSDTTYLVPSNSAVNLYGTTTFEGGTVIKYDVSSEIDIQGDVNCVTDKYRPAILTAIDDDSCGESIGNGSPSGTYANVALSLDTPCNLSDLRVSYANEAIDCWYANYGVSDVQILNCNVGLHTEYGAFTARNILMSYVGTDFYGSYYQGDVEQMTSDQGNNVTDDHNFSYGDDCNPGPSSWINMTNSLLTSIGNWGIVPVNTDQVYYWSYDPGIYQTVGAADYYLADDTYRANGEPNIDPGLMADLQQETTYPPLWLTNVITNYTILSPQAPRDTNSSPDVGYHYAPIDFLASCMVSNTTLLLTNGVTLAYYNDYGIWMENGSQLVCQGTPNQHNYFVYYAWVQEQPINLSTQSTNVATALQQSLAINPYHDDPGRDPSLYLRLTTLSAANGSGYAMYIGDYGWVFTNLNVRDCEIYGAGADWYEATIASVPVEVFKNNLFHRTPIDIYCNGQLAIYNNLVVASTNADVQFVNMGVSTSWTNQNNAFDGGDVYMDGTIGYNAYLNGSIYNNSLQTNDIATNLTWATGPLGNYYQFTTSPLVNAGNTSAANIGFYYYTTTQIPETNSIVDIGYHYVALDGNGLPIDANDDGIPDYLEAPNGPSPSILTPPTNLTVFAGQDATWTVVANGPGPLSYQWQSNGVSISGATNSSLTFFNVTSGQSGTTCKVTVSNAGGAVTSSNATLTVDVPSCFSSPTNLVGWWQGESNALDALGVDSGILQGGVSFVSGKVGEAFSFDGSTGLVDVPAANNLNVGAGSGFTIEGWIQPSDLSYGQPLFEWSGGGDTEVCLWMSLTTPGSLDADIEDTGYDDNLITSASAVIDTNDLQHVALTYDSLSGVACLYVNGVQVQQATLGAGVTALTTGDLYFGYDGCCNFFKGQMDEIALYNTALTASNITGIYNSSYLGKCGIAPSFILQPASQTVTAGNNVAIATAAMGTSLHFQWFFNGLLLEGANQPTLVLTDVQAAQAGSYYVIVNNAFGSITSSNAVLAVYQPQCVSAPTNLISWWQAESNGLDSVGGNNGTLQGNVIYAPGKVGQAFRFDGQGEAVSIGYATNLQLQNFTITAWIQRASLLQASLDSGGGYVFSFGSQGYGFGLDDDGKLFLSQLDDSAVNSAARITDTNWHFVSATVTNGAVSFYLDDSAYSSPGYNANFTFGTPAAIGARGDNFGNSFIGLIDEVEVFGRALASNEVAGIYNAGSYGVCYSVPPAILVQPQSQTANVGESVSFSVSATGTSPLSYQWQFNGANISGATASSYNLNNVLPGDAGNYSVMVMNMAGMVSSAQAVLSVLGSAAPSGLVGWWQAEGNTLDATGLNPPGLVEGTVTYVPGEVGQAFSFGGGSDVHVVASPSLDVGGNGGGVTIEGWINPTSTSNNYSVVESDAGGPGNAVAGLLGSVNTNGDLYAYFVDGEENWHEVWSSGGVISSNTFSHVALTYDPSNGVARLYCNGVEVDVPGQTMGVFTPQVCHDLYLGYSAYWGIDYQGQLDEMSIYNRALSGTEITAIYNDGVVGKHPIAPAIVTQPQNQIANVGGNATFSVVASGTSPLSYQWLLNGTPIAGAAGSIYIKHNAQPPDDGGIYSVIIRNAAGSITSANASLSVGTLPVVTQFPTSQSVMVGGNAQFTVGATGGGLQYQWMHNSVAIPSQTTAVLNVNNAKTTDAGIYSVAVSNAKGAATAGANLLVIQSHAFPQSFTLFGATPDTPYDLYMRPSLSPGVSYRLFYCGSPGQTYFQGPMPTGTLLFFAAGLAVDTDGDGLMDGYEGLVSHSNWLLQDSDHDGLPDGWEAEWGISPVNNPGGGNASADPDGDGFTNLQEYNNGTDPFENNSTPRPVVTVSAAGGAFQISRTGSTSSPLTVNYTVGGTAIYGTDYTFTPAPSGSSYPLSITIPSGASSVTLTPSTVVGKTVMIGLVPFALSDAPNPATWTYVVNPYHDRANANLFDSDNDGISDGGVLIFKWYTPVNQ